MEHVLLMFFEGIKIKQMPLTGVPCVNWFNRPAVCVFCAAPGSPHLRAQQIGAQHCVPPQTAPPLTPFVLHFCAHQSVRLKMMTAAGTAVIICQIEDDDCSWNCMIAPRVQTCF